MASPGAPEGLNRFTGVQSALVTNIAVVQCGLSHIACQSNWRVKYLLTGRARDDGKDDVPGPSFHLVDRCAEPDPPQALAVDEKEGGICDDIGCAATYAVRAALQLRRDELTDLDIAKGYETAALCTIHCPTSLRLFHECSTRDSTLRLTRRER